MNLTITGIDRTVENLGKVEAGIASEKPMEKAVQIVTKDARANTPVDQGVTRASITPSIHSRRDMIIGVVGSNKKSALWAEKGTRPHWPPIRALEGWARRHGTKAYLVALAISRHGTKGHHMLQRALDDNQSRIIREFQDYYNRLSREANS